MIQNGFSFPPLPLSSLRLQSSVLIKEFAPWDIPFPPPPPDILRGTIFQDFIFKLADHFFLDNKLFI